METISCHSNQSSYPIGTKITIIRPPTPTYRCYMWNMETIGFTALEEKSFENVDRRRTDDGRTDGRRMPAYTISSHMSLRLRWANKPISYALKWNTDYTPIQILIWNVTESIRCCWDGLNPSKSDIIFKICRRACSVGRCCSKYHRACSVAWCCSEYVA